MNKIACILMLILSGTCLLNAELAPPKTSWYGKYLDYTGVSIVNKVPLPQAGIRRHDVDSTAYDITPVKFKMSTTLSKKPKTKEEWYYKGIYYIIVKYCGPISDPDDGGTIYFEQNYEHRVVFDPKHYGEWGIIYTWVHVIARFTNTDIDAEGDRGCLLYTSPSPRDCS